MQPGVAQKSASLRHALFINLTAFEDVDFMSKFALSCISLDPVAYTCHLQNSTAALSAYYTKAGSHTESSVAQLIIAL